MLSPLAPPRNMYHYVDKNSEFLVPKEIFRSETQEKGKVSMSCPSHGSDTDCFNSFCFVAYTWLLTNVTIAQEQNRNIKCF